MRLPVGSGGDSIRTSQPSGRANRQVDATLRTPKRWLYEAIRLGLGAGSAATGEGGAASQSRVR